MPLVGARAGDLGAALQEAAAVIHEVGLFGEGECVGGAASRLAVARSAISGTKPRSRRPSAMMSSATSETVSVRQRLRMVSSRLSGAVVMRARMVAGGGSSRVLSRVLAASRAHAVGGLDDDDAVAALEGVARDRFDEAAHLTDADIARVRVGLVAATAATEAVARFEVEDVGMAAFGDEVAGAALVAGAGGFTSIRGRVGMVAVEQAGEFEGEKGAPRAGGAGEEEGVGRLLHRRDAAQDAAHALVPDDVVLRHRGQLSSGKRGGCVCGEGLCYDQSVCPAA